MPNTLDWNSFDHDLRELYGIAADLVAGRGGPEQYRARGSDPRLLMPGFGRTSLIVGIWDDSYGPSRRCASRALFCMGNVSRNDWRGWASPAISSTPMICSHAITVPGAVPRRTYTATTSSRRRSKHLEQMAS